MRYCFDTGYFYTYATEGLPAEHRRPLMQIADGTAIGFASAIVLYELRKLSLRGALDEDAASFIMEVVRESCTVDRSLSRATLDKAARLSYGEGLSMADAFILNTALTHEADTFYTSDEDFSSYGGSLTIINLRDIRGPGHA